MKYLKMKDSWLVLETGQEIYLGRLILNMYDFWYEKNKEEMCALLDFSEGEEDTITLFLEVMDCYLESYNDEIYEKKFRAKESSLRTIEYQKKRQEKFIERIKENGWKEVPLDYDANIIDWYLLMTCNMDKIKLQTTHHFYKNKWYPAYEIMTAEDEVALAFIDLQELRNHGYNFCRCQNCWKLFARDNLKKKYCDSCTKNYKKIMDKKRRDTPRGKHKAVCNYLRNSVHFNGVSDKGNKELDAFLDESNYYWDKLKGKVVDTNNNFSENINSEEDYVLWLEKKHQSYKKAVKEL